MLREDFDAAPFTKVCGSFLFSFFYWAVWGGPATLDHTKIYNAAPENGWSEDDISFWDGLFSDATLDIHDKNKALIRGY